MKILLVGSGSGGHIYPALSFGKYLSHKNIIHYYLIFKEIDKEIYDSNNMTYEYIANDLEIREKLKEIKKIIVEKEITKVVTFGGKNTYFIGLVAKKLKIDHYICEQNVILGKANMLLYPFAKYCFASLPIKRKLKKVITLGSPATDYIKKNKLILFNNMKYTILIVCGSLGSSSINNLIKNYVINNDNFNFIIIKGKNVTDQTYPLKDNLLVYDYYQPLTDLINHAHLVISRAGATTISEIIALEKPSIIIPSPYVSNNHQLKNAQFLNKNNACLMIEEKDLNDKLLNDYINKLLFSNFERKRIIDNLIKLKSTDTCQKMLELMEE